MAIELPGWEMKIPYIAADSACALGKNIMKPYGEDYRKGSLESLVKYLEMLLVYYVQS